MAVAPASRRPDGRRLGARRRDAAATAAGTVALRFIIRRVRHQLLEERRLPPLMLVVDLEEVAQLVAVDDEEVAVDDEEVAAVEGVGSDPLDETPS
jgi:hypothetical protein